jgi:fimbrial chaperone protein
MQPNNSQVRQETMFRPIRYAISTLILVLLFTEAVFAGEWRVMPIRLDLGKEARTGAITVVNDGKMPINYQIKAYEWTQDAAGKDSYVETADLIVFPKIMTINTREEKVIRIGIGPIQARNEKTYRIFIEELPPPRKDQDTGVSVAIKFGVPVFVKPLAEDIQGIFDAPAFGNGAFSFAIKNPGTVNFNITKVLVKGKDSAGNTILAKETAGWYLLSGSSRTYSVSVSQEDCARLSSLELEAINDKKPLKTVVPIDKAHCKP